MTDHLSDELARWPINPRTILNVPSSAGKSEIRKAYAQLIRRFRPETHPQHFQRIREAMEILLAGLDDENGSESFSVELTSDYGIAQVGLFDSRQQPSGNDVRRESDASSISQSVHGSASWEAERDQVWAEYTQRPSAECLQKLQDLAVRSDRDPVPFLMGCWAARLRPDLARERRPFEWIREGIEKFGGTTELVELLMEELRDNTTLLSEEDSGHLAERIQSSELLQAYLSSRWKLMAQRGVWQWISREYEAMQVRFSYSHPEVWLQITLRVFELSVPASDPNAQKLVAMAREELRTLSSSRNSHQQFEYADVLEFIRRSHQNRSGTSDERLRQLVLDSPTLDAEQFHLRVLEIVGIYIDLPSRLLQILTELAMQVPESLWLLSTHPQAWGRPAATAEARRDQTLLRAVELLFRQSGQLAYGDLRVDIAEFCRAECINSGILIDTLVQLNESGSVLISQTILSQVARDLSLLLTCEWNWIFLHSCSAPHLE
jgi:hypothetical protein